MHEASVEMFLFGAWHGRSGAARAHGAQISMGQVAFLLFFYLYDFYEPPRWISQALRSRGEPVMRPTARATAECRAPPPVRRLGSLSDREPSS